MKMSNRNFLFLILVFLISSTNLIAANAGLTQCKHEDCLRKLILSPDAPNIPERQCKALDGKTSTSLFKEDLGMLCRLYIARKKADKRSKYRCAYDFYSPNSDYTSGLSTINHWLYSDYLYAGLAKHEKIKPRLESTTNNNSTIYNTYVLSRFDSVKTKHGEKNIKFTSYFCIAEVIRQQFYIPYFMSLKVTNKKQKKSSYLVMRYIDKPPYWNQPIVRQIPKGKLKNSYEQTMLKDMNNDSLLDLVYLDSPQFKRYLPGICLADKKADSCKIIQADTATPKSAFFGAEAFLKIKSKKEILVITQDKHNQESQVPYVYRIENDQIKPKFK